MININFRKKVVLDEIEFYVNYKADESYTPNLISIRIGTNFSDLQELKTLEIPKNTGWVSIALRNTKK